MADAQRESERKGVTAFKTEPETEQVEQLVVTINPATGRIVKIHRVDNAGKNQEFSEQDFAKLVGEDEVEEIETALDEAFEAGVIGVLGEDYMAETEDEDEEETTIRRFLISEILIPRSVRRRILHRMLMNRMLRRGIVRRRVRQAEEEQTARKRTH